MTSPLDTPRGRALVAFLGHGPGLRLFTTWRFDEATWRENLLALGATLVAMAIAGAVAAEPGWPVFWSWFVGHFCWSGWLAARVRSSTLSSAG